MPVSRIASLTRGHILWLFLSTNICAALTIEYSSLSKFNKTFIFLHIFLINVCLVQPQRHIQVNLSKEYFSSLSNEEEDTQITDERDYVSLKVDNFAKHGLSEDFEKFSDEESGITPIMHGISPIKGIIKNTKEVCQFVFKLFTKVRFEAVKF